jgi:tripartite-type tricarboxylate transporter receptor subunit TctC
MKLIATILKRAFAIAALAYLSLANAQQQTIVVPYPAGQLSDIIARVMRDSLARQGFPNLIVENVGGAGGSIGAQRALTTGRDGNTLLLASPNEVILAPLANAAVKYRSEDFRLVGHVAVAPLVLITRPDLPVTSVDEFAKLIRSKSESKQPLTYGSVGIGSLYHFMGEHMSKLTGAELTHIPYKGGGPMIGDLVGSRLDFATIPYSPMLQGLVDQGKIKLMASVGPSRPPALSKLPTVSESAALKGYAFEIWTGFVVPDTASTLSRARWHLQLSQALADPQVRSALEAQGLTVSKPMQPAELDQLYTAETERFRRLATAIKLTPQ